MIRRLLPPITVLIALIVGGCAPSQDEGEATSSGSVDVAMISALSGPLGGYGKTYREGFEAGLDYATEGTGAVDGTKINVNWMDDQGNPDNAVSLAREAVGKGTKILAGSASSATAIAVADQAAQNKVLFISGAAATDAVTGVNDYTFRSGRQTYQDVATVGQMLSEVKDSKIVVFAQENAFGQGNVAAIKAVLGAQGATIEPVLVAEDATEFTPFAAKINAAAPDLAFVAWAGASSTSMWAALGQQGVLEKTTVVTGLGDVASYGIYGRFGEQITFLNHYFPGMTGTDAEKAMIESIEAAGGTPDLFSPDGFVTAQLLVKAIAAGDDVDAQIKALEGYSFESVKGTLTVRAEDHALLQPMFEAKLEPQGDTFTPKLVTTFDADDVAPPVAPAK